MKYDPLQLQQRWKYSENSIKVKTRIRRMAQKIIVVMFDRSY